METIYDKLKRHFETTPQDKIDSDWKSTEKYDSIGPTVKEYFKNNIKIIK